MMKPSAPVSSALASVHCVHTTLFEYQASVALQNRTANTFFLLFCFNYWPTRFISTLHGSASTAQMTPSAFGHFTLKDQFEYRICFGSSRNSSLIVSVSPADGAFIDKKNYSSIFVLACHTHSKNRWNKLKVFVEAICLHLSSDSAIKLFYRSPV